MTDNDEMENWNDALIEEYLLFLRGRGPEPDLSDLPPNRQDEVRGQFEVVKAMADRGPELPPLEQDPVARRLGLVGPDAASSALILPGSRHQTLEAGDVLEALEEIAFRFQGRIVIDREPTWSLDAPQGLRAAAQCTVLAEVIAVLVGDMEARAELPEQLTVFFSLRAEVSAVCVSSPDAQQALVFSPAGVTRSLNPARGWVDPHSPNSPEPLDLALGRFCEQRVPRWDQVAAADVFTAVNEIGAEATEVLDRQIEMALRARPRLQFKKEGQRVLAKINRGRVVSLLASVQAGDLAQDALVEELAEIAGAGVS